MAPWTALLGWSFCESEVAGKGFWPQFLGGLVEGGLRRQSGRSEMKRRNPGRAWFGPVG